VQTTSCTFKRNPISKKSGLLDLVHTDLCSMRDKTIAGALYFVTFVDDNSRKLWAYSLKINDQVLNVFKQWIVGVKRETEKKLKCIR
jgi:hypothetical protein